jgi:hypothetical protein
MTNKVIINLNQHEYDALIESAIRELRSPADQARFFIRNELTQCGLLTLQIHKSVQSLTEIDDNQGCIIDNFGVTVE